MKLGVMALALLAFALLFGCLGGGQPTATPVPTFTPVPSVSQAPVVSETPSATATPTPAPTKAANEIRISGYKFVPDKITIKKGATVTWVNDDQAKHTVTADAGYTGPDSALLAQGESYSYTFDTVGIVAYHCSPHPYMKATVEVTG